jgi:hypothetical protein
MVFRIAVAKTFSHARNRLLLGLVLSVIATALQYLFQIRGLSDTAKIAISFAGSAVIAMVSAFVWHLIVTPAVLYVEPKKRSAVEEYYFQVAKAALVKHGADAIRVLRHLRMRGQLIPSTFPSDMEHQKVFDLLKALGGDGIVHEEEVRTPAGPGLYSSPTAKLTWTISPGLESVIDGLLHAPDEV